MAKPWEKYAAVPDAAAGPWQAYAPAAPVDAMAAPEPYSGDNMLTDAAAGVGNFVRGLGAGVVSTGVGAYDLARKITPTVIAPNLPEVPAGLRAAAEAPNSLMGKAGKFVEQAAEFMIPGMAVSKAVKGAPLLGRMAAEGALGGGVAAVQTGGDPGAAVPAAALGAVAPLSGAAMQLIGKTKLPERLYRSALKPTWAMEKKEGSELIKTGLEMGIPVSAKGLDVLETQIARTGKQITDAIQNQGKQGVTIDPGKVLSALDELEGFYRKTPGGDDGLAAIKEMRDWFSEKGYTLGGGSQGPVRSLAINDAQEMKVNLYRLLKKSYGEFKGAKVESLKNTARGLKEQIEQAFPEIKNLNAEQSKRLALDEALYRAVWRIDNHQMMGIGSPIAASAGHALLGGPGAAVGFLGKLMLDDPTIKSKVAIALAKAGDKNAPRTVSRWLSGLKAGAQAAVTSRSE